MIGSADMRQDVGRNMIAEHLVPLHPAIQATQLILGIRCVDIDENEVCTQSVVHGSEIRLKLRIPLDVIRAVADPLEQDSKLLDQARGGL
jgi:hypothetical protein